MEIRFVKYDNSSYIMNIDPITGIYDQFLHVERLGFNSLYSNGTGGSNPDTTSWIDISKTKFYPKKDTDSMILDLLKDVCGNIRNSTITFSESDPLSFYVESPKGYRVNIGDFSVILSDAKDNYIFECLCSKWVIPYLQVIPETWKIGIDSAEKRPSSSQFTFKDLKPFLNETKYSYWDC